ncbi:MAG: UDP-N-acetyl-D-glucosamine dehydrogenase [Thermoanaerobaculia bacterium]|jgi:UDP-N-acetyl-D-glucosamine dehydrogenase|nr:UDP-N-acetyl-D-glucosamine dehydrogenase [Thermoanaerobaculia bacterium]
MTATSGPQRIDTLIESIRARSARIGVIGLGYVGLPLVLLFEEAGFPVTGFDVDTTKTGMLNAGETYIRHIGRERIAKAFGNEKVFATADFDRLADCDAILICVPTPLGTHREPDLRYIRITAEEIARRLRPGQIVVLESTTYPGTTREELLSRFEARGLVCGRDYFVGFSPEREDPGNERFNTRNIPKVVGGIDAPSLRAATELYSAVVDRVVPVSSTEVAESAKLLENIFRAVNIALVNEMKVVFERMGIDVWEVIEAAKTKPFGFMPFYPGPGLGGHCIPLDPFYLTWKAAEYGTWARFIELAGEVNASMPRYVVDRTVEAVNKHGKSIVGATVLVMGLSYKPDIDDDRESPSFELIEMLQARGAVVAYCDPYVPQARRGRKHDVGLRSIPCTAEAIGQYDAVVVSTPHTQFRDPSLWAKVRLAIDTRNIVPRGVAGLDVVRA